jgi:ABC-type antimicrobial peptide transport system permease subunit
MDQIVAQAVADRRFGMLVLGLFAALALALAVTGLYAVMSYTVNQRTHEIGVRMALGAQPQQVRLMVLSQGLRLAGVGLAAGGVGALFLGRAMAAVVATVEGPGPLLLGLVAAGLLGVAALACWVPARRATRIDPMIALRGE